MVTYYVKKNEVYKVSATVNCAVYDASGSTIFTCDAGETITFTAKTAKISISDDNAALTRSAESSVDVSDLSEHVSDSSVHVTETEKANWNSVVDTVTTDFPEVDNHINNSTVHVTADQKAVLDDPTLNERVMNIPELFPGSGSGDAYDMFTLQQALNLANQYITIRGLTEKVTGGLKVKFKTLEGDYVEYMWNGEGAITNETAWTAGATGSDTDVLNKAECDSLYAPLNYETANGILITDSNGNVSVSTVISVAELNTLNNNLTNISNKLADLESRLAALES